MSKLDNISPIDSRYNKQHIIRNLCSYKNQLQSKVTVELSWFFHLCKEYGFEIKDGEFIELTNRSVNEINHVIEIEKSTKHDIKAIEYYIREIVFTSEFFNRHTEEEKVKILNLIHFGLTSQDIVSLATNLLFYKISQVFICGINDVISHMKTIFSENNVLMVGYTHGQPAIPINSSLIYHNYRERLEALITKLENIQPRAKFGGAIGDNSSLKLVGVIDIEEIMDSFINEYDYSKNFIRSKNTTQIDNWVYLVDLLKEYLQISSIFIDLCRDIWHYCSINYLVQKKDDKQIGSSTMVQKTNPINFENCEGIMEKLESDFSFYIKKFSKSRLQRDLSDSVVIRMVFESFAMFNTGMISFSRGLSNIEFNTEKITSELNNHYEISTEYIQLFLKYNGVDMAYELVKEKLEIIPLTNRESYVKFIDSLIDERIITEEMYYEMMEFNLSHYKNS